MSEQANSTERQITIQRALTAARLAGSAEAMKQNLTLMGADSTMWDEESKVWVQRRNDIVNSLPDGKISVGQLATEATHNAFENNRIVDLRKLQPADSQLLEEAA
jgi:hypothetical protein